MEGLLSPDTPTRLVSISILNCSVLLCSYFYNENFLPMSLVYHRNLNAQLIEQNNYSIQVYKYLLLKILIIMKYLNF